MIQFHLFLPNASKGYGESNVFTGVCLSMGVGGTPVSGPMSLPSLWSQICSGGYASLWSQSQLGGTPVTWDWSTPQLRLGYPLAGTGVPLCPPTPHLTGQTMDKIHCSQHASCIFTQEDFLVLFKFSFYFFHFGRKNQRKRMSLAFQTFK